MSFPTENSQKPMYSDKDLERGGALLSEDEQHAPFSSQAVAEIFAQQSESPRSEVLIINPEKIENFSVAIIAEVLTELSMQLAKELFSDRAIAEVSLGDALERITQESFRLAKEIAAVETEAATDDNWIETVRNMVRAEAVNKHIQGEVNGDFEDIFEGLFSDEESLKIARQEYYEDKKIVRDTREIALRRHIRITLLYGWANKQRVLTGTAEEGDQFPIVHMGATAEAFEAFAQHSQLYDLIEYDGKANLGQIINWWLLDGIEGLKANPVINALVTMPFAVGEGSSFEEYALLPDSTQGELFDPNNIDETVEGRIIELAGKKLSNEEIALAEPNQLLVTAVEQIVESNPVLYFLLPLAFTRQESLQQLLFTISQKVGK